MDTEAIDMERLYGIRREAHGAWALRYLGPDPVRGHALKEDQQLVILRKGRRKGLAEESGTAPKPLRRPQRTQVIAGGADAAVHTGGGLPRCSRRLDGGVERR
jgi:hypothetical protein